MKRSYNDSSSSKKGLSESITKIDEKSIVTAEGNKFIDSGGGFLLEVTDEKDDNSAPAACFQFHDVEEYVCQKCKQVFFESYLLKHFEEHVCDECKANDEYQLMPKTDVLSEFLLTDSDLTRRGPPLKFITRPNPHNTNWGQMKLFLRCQVLKRALEKWETMEKLEEAHLERESKRLKSQTKKYKKAINDLRKNVRSSCYKVRTSASHQHEFSSEEYNEDEDNYTRVCDTCGFVDTFEKM